MLEIALAVGFGSAEAFARAFKLRFGCSPQPARPCFEHYPTDATFDPATGVFSCEICIAVMPL